ncbi:MAG: hypothetical protein ABSB19_01220 [Methylomonas sp.]|jgi:truncated hemoglobin YjbI
MHTNVLIPTTINFSGVVDEAILSSLVDLWYEKMLEDYRINRFFYTKPLAEQTAPLKNFLSALLRNQLPSPEELSDLLDEYFTAAFARTNAKPSLVNNQDFAFLLDIVGGREIRTICFLCASHGHLLKLEPDDENYDVALELLTDAMKQLRIPVEQAAKITAIAESARNAVLGRGFEIMQEAA